MLTDCSKKISRGRFIFNPAVAKFRFPHRKKRLPDKKNAFFSFPGAQFFKSGLNYCEYVRERTDSNQREKIMGNLKKKRRKKIAKHKRKKQLKLLRHKKK